jgi:hypothetical protein
MLDIQDEFYEATKIPKGRYSYTLKSEVLKAMKRVNDEISIDKKLTANYLINTLLNFQKRSATKEYKQREDKKKISKLMNDLCEPSVETNTDKY